MQQFLSGYPMESLTGHLAYGLILGSFLVRKMIFLRSFAILASLSSIYFYYHLKTGAQWIPIKWNFIFIAINIFHITMELLSKRKIQLQKNEEMTYTKYFTNLTPVEFLRILKVGHSRSYHSGAVLIDQGIELPALFLILEGEVEVFIDHQLVAKLVAGDFIGEMSFITDKLTTAKVVVSKESKIHFWEKDNLKTFLNKNSALLSKFHGAIGNQLITKLISKSITEAQKEELKKVS